MPLFNAAGLPRALVQVGVGLAESVLPFGVTHVLMNCMLIGADRFRYRPRV